MLHVRTTLLALAALSAAGCSFTVATGFTECEASADCEAGQVCAEGYCVPNTVPAGCGEAFGAADDANAIHLGAALPMHPAGGAVDESEVAGLNAMKLAVEEINQRTIRGRPLALHLCDTQASSEKVKEMTGWLIDQRRSVAVITSGSGQTIAASTVTLPRSAVLMSATATSPEISSLLANAGPERLVWRTAPSDAIQGKAIAKILDQPDAGFGAVQRVGVIYVDDPYGQGLKEVLQLEVPAASTRTVSTVPYPRGGDVSAAVNQLNGFDPDLTVLVGFPDDAVKIVQAGLGLGAASNLTVAKSHRWFFTDSAKDPKLMSDLGTQASEIQDSFGTSPAQGAGVAYQSFKDSFQARFQTNPDSYSFTSHSYDAIYVLALAMVQQAGSGTVDGLGVAKGLTTLSSGLSFRLTPTQFSGAANELAAGRSIDVDGASGNLDFDPAKGEAPSPIELWQVTGATFTTRATIEP